MFSLGFGDLETGAGVEDFGYAVGDCRINRTIVGMQ